MVKSFIAFPVVKLKNPQSVIIIAGEMRITKNIHAVHGFQTGVAKRRPVIHLNHPARHVVVCAKS